MGDYAASGGYYIAMGADAIVAEPGTITGSIGVFSGKFSLRGLYEKLGVSQETVQRGKNATLFSGCEPWTDEERAKVRGLNVAFYETFVAKAAEGRNKTPQEIDAVAQGRVWTGERGASGRSRGRARRARCRRGRWRGSGPASRKGRRSRWWSCPRGRASSRRSWSGRTRTSLARLLGPGAASLLRWATELGDQGPIARVPFDLQVR